ncbi:MAG: hypothetical protein ACI4EV_03355 [Lachnospiraceae bacterium]
MNSTKILVLRQKHLIIALIVIVLAILLLILSINGVFSGNKSAAAASNSASSSSTTTYKPGVYTASVIINGSPMDVRLTVDENNINDIELLNVSESITTMYPLIETSFEDIKNQVIENKGTQGINFSTENTYSATTLLNAIELALNKANVQ